MAVGKGKEDDLDQAYEILGVDEESTDKEIQSAYRKLSLKWHPDKNPDDKEAATEKFDQITRCKDTLLDPVKRAELDRKRKTTRDLEARFEMEDGKRKKMRQDLEGREAAAAAGKPRPCDAPSAADLRKKSAQMDYAERLNARKKQVAERHTEVVAEVVQTRAAAEEARLKITWRAGGPAVSTEVIHKALKEYDVLQITVSEEGGVAQFASREDALRAVLECRQRKHQLSFRVALVDVNKKDAEAPSAATKRKDPVKSAPVGFADFEADMLAGLANLAKKQKAAKS